MTWEYGIIGLITGIIIGAILMRFGSNKIRNQIKIKHELKKAKLEIIGYHKELEKHFIHSKELLNNISRDYHALHQHIENGMNDILSSVSHREYLSSYSINEKDNEHLSIKIPLDYSENTSTLLREEHMPHN